MNIGIIGLGLMGASFAKALHQKTSVKVFGTDKDEKVVKQAQELSVIDCPLTLQNAPQLDMLVVASYPRIFRQALQPYLPLLKEGTVVTDFCGIKRTVMKDMDVLSKQYPHLYFVGSHPMAGSELSGFAHSRATLFNGASLILVPCTDSEDKLQFLKDFYLSFGFGKVVVCDAEHHDAMVAYTSQLCHVVSNAFIKNQSADKHMGYSANSYLDLTRVAKMNSGMWAQLMTDNRDKLSAELSELIDNLQQYLSALQNGDEETLRTLLEEGNVRKLQIDARKSK